MDMIDLLTHIMSFLGGGAVGSLITIKINNKNLTNQKNIAVTNGDVVGRDKK